MKIACISDTHQHHRKIVLPEDCDVIVHAGDFTYNGELFEVRKFIDWYADLPIQYKVLIAGNHEVKTSSEDIQQMCIDNDIIYLNNTSQYINGYLFWGSPYSVKFGNWAYGATEEELEEMYSRIPHYVDVIITHGPAFQRLDFCPNGHVGSKALAKRIGQLNGLQLHITGHIHESRGCAIHHTDNYQYLTVNASICGIPYPDVIVNPITVEL